MRENPENADVAPTAWQKCAGLVCIFAVLALVGWGLVQFVGYLKKSGDPPVFEDDPVPEETVSPPPLADELPVVDEIEETPVIVERVIEPDPEPEIVEEPDPEPEALVDIVEAPAPVKGAVVRRGEPGFDPLIADARRRLEDAESGALSPPMRVQARSIINSAARLARFTTVYFDSGDKALSADQRGLMGSSVLDDPEFRALAANAEGIQCGIFILGFADTVGASDFNLTLSKQRADSVATIVRGWVGDGRLPCESPSTRIVSLGIGETNYGESRQNDRAVEVWGIYIDDE